MALIRAVAFAFTLLVVTQATAAESLWLEAEHFSGVRGYCWPMGKPEMKKTAGHFGLSGPGWAAEWQQGGESGFLSIAAGADDDRAAVEKLVEIPEDGDYSIWVRYGDWREKPEPFRVQIEQDGQPTFSSDFGDRPIIEEDNEMKLYFGWAFAWDRRGASLKKGPARLRLSTYCTAPEPRQIDVVAITSDASYRPRIKERPQNETRRLLDSWKVELPANLEPLARRRGDWSLPAAWRIRTFRDKGFLYLWNTGHTNPLETWLSDKPDRVKFPYNIIDAAVREEFEKKYGGRDDVPIFSDPRVTPTFHGAGAGVFATDGAGGDVQPLGKRFAEWLDRHPDRAWAMMMNYHPGAPIGAVGAALFQKYRDRYVGSISGESLGYFYPPADQMKAATEAAKTRRELVAAFAPLTLQENAAKYRQIYGADLDANPYQDVIACLSIGNIAFAPLCLDWGARTVGYESSAATSSLLSMRMAFMRGAARQHEALMATYRSCNFGDASTIFSNGASFTSPQNLLDNYYSVYSGAGMTWYKFDIWHQYMSGSAMFYHEQGFDEFWKPGGTTAAGVHEVQLSPKGKLVDRFLRVTAEDFDRGNPFTPVAFLVDHAHGWEPAPFWPNSFKNWHEHSDRFLFGDHEKMLEEYFWTAYHPIQAESEKPITATNEVYVAGIFGDIFDVIFAYPDVAKWRTIDTYPVVIAAGEIELTQVEGRRLADYVGQGGTLIVAEAHLTGPGVAELGLPETGAAAEAAEYRWLDDQEIHASSRFRYRPIIANGGRPLAATASGDTFCAAFDRGAGRLIYLSIPQGMTISKHASPIVARLLAHATRDLSPIEVRGDVEWMLNQTGAGWNVTLLNPAGQAKPQQGITPTDYRENRSVEIICRVPVQSARDLLLPGERLSIASGVVNVEVPAGGVRIIEVK